MEFNVQMEKPSNILRKLTIRVPAEAVASRLERGFQEIQKTARIKGFRPGHVPISIIRQYYDSDVRHRTFHNLIDESYRQAVKDQKIQAVSSPRIETPDHQTGAGDHDHSIKDGQDLTFTATVEVLPEIDAKGYKGLSLTKGKVELADEDVDLVLKGFRESQAELVPAGGGIMAADGTETSRPVQAGDFVDVNFTGGVVTDEGSVEERPEMTGSRIVEIGSNSLITGFEDNLIGMRKGETKTFRIPFPEDFHDKSLAGKQSEFTALVNEVKEKKLPALDDEFAKQAGYESVVDLREKARAHLMRERTQEVERKLRSDLLQALIEKNPFEVPSSLVQAQTKALAEDVAGNLKNQGFNDEMIREALTSEMENLKKRAENQVRASLILEAIAKKENITLKPEELDQEVTKIAESMKVEESRLREYYGKNPGRLEDVEFRMREDRTVRFVLDQAKIK